MKKRFNTIVLVVSIISAFVVGFCSATGIFVWRTVNVSNSSSKSADFQRFNTVYNNINQGYYKKVDREKLMDGAINGMLASLDDPYTQYIDASQMESFNNSISGNVSGIGVVVALKQNQVTIDSVVADSPAQKAGLKIGDVIYKVDGKSTKNMTINKVTDMVKGQENTKVTITIKRGTQEFDKTIVRKKLAVTSINYHVDPSKKDVGYIQITEFTDHTAKDLKNALQELNKKKVSRVIIDLRSNPGGELDQAILASSIFLKNGDTIVSTQERSGKKVSYKAKSSDNGGYKFHKEVSLLVDGNTASAAEIFTAALNENIGSQIIGSKTFGKGIVQSVVPVDANSEMKFTSSKWLTPKDHWIHLKGIKPTISVKEDSLASLTFKDEKTYKLGDRSDDIEATQKILKRLGSDVNEDGYFDGKTEAALKTYQQKNNLTADGKLTEKTKETLYYNLADILRDKDVVYQKALNLK
ncbi:S41 family peptidase [Lactobacillus sp. YT155]|uniref:S41 family peptidase n=1 Tax=Lactobacillus sp. YT155 TaxID=3060955 RepID=UPI00265DF5DB|nr:S41 family peptidase [Lactobacillus sp. YT155]MDO1605396.1 S41 family peptidase [Lactobacillus sp. YT155]